MEKNPIKFIRNPNSPEAIQARLDGYTDPTPYEPVKLINDIDESHMRIDLTEVKVDQLVNYPIAGGHKDHLNKKLVRTSLHTDKEGRSIITNYYTDVRNLQWVIIKSFLNRDLPTRTDNALNHPVPRATFPNTFGFFASAPGETWVNQGLSVDKLRAAQKRIFKTPDVAPNADLDKEQPEDRYKEHFTGQR